MTLRVDVFTIFPGMVEAYAGESILGRAGVAGHLDVRAHDLRLATEDAHRTIDDSPFGGGAGMVMMPEPVFAAVADDFLAFVADDRLVIHNAGFDLGFLNAELESVKSLNI